MLLGDLSLIVRYARVHSERSMADVGIGFSEQLVIMYLSAFGTANQRMIASHYGLDQGAIAKTTRKLEEKGLVRRTVSDADRREKHLELTEAGEGVIESMSTAYRVWDEAVLADVSAQDRALFEDILGRMARNSERLVGKDS